jgi:hypothetical protein
MGQFDSATDAALKQLNFEEISKTPGGEFAEIIGDLIALSGVSGPLAIAGAASNLLLRIRGLAGASYASNLIFAIEAVGEDLKSLRETQAELRSRIDALPTNPRFAEAIAALALRAMHTSVKDRLRRLARIVVNGLKEDDLEQESLDDMMRAAAELTERDVNVLGLIYKIQKHLFSPHELNRDYGSRINAIHSLWESHWKSEERPSYQGMNGMNLNGSFARLQSAGLIVSIGTTSVLRGPTMHDYELLPAGKKFYERLQEITAD